MRLYRQGDVLLIADAMDDSEYDFLAEDTAGVRPFPIEQRDRRGRLVLALGEATGHAHAILDKGAEIRNDTENRRFLRVLEEAGVTLAHEEHAHILLEKGIYEIRHQREWDGDRKEPIWVVD
jgi:hypothetical protein